MGEAVPRYLTADALAGIPSLADVPVDEQQLVLHDAAEILGYVAANQWTPDVDVRAEFERRDWGPDRFNRAIGVLRDTGKLLIFDDDYAHDLVAPTTTEPTVPDDPEAEDASRS